MKRFNKNPLCEFITSTSKEYRPKHILDITSTSQALTGDRGSRRARIVTRCGRWPFLGLDAREIQHRVYLCYCNGNLYVSVCFFRLTIMI